MSRFPGRWRVVALAVLLAIGTVACDGGGPDDDQSTRRDADNRKLAAEYARVEGTYKGVIDFGRASVESVEAVVGLYTTYVMDGIDAKGRERVRPVLRANFRLLSVIGELDDHVLDVVAGEYTGNMIFTVPGEQGGGGGVKDCQVGARDAQLSFQDVTVAGLILNAAIYRTGGYWGKLRAERVSADAAASVTGVDDKRTRLEKGLAKVAGNYSGHIVYANGDMFGAELLVKVVDTLVAGEGGRKIACPALQAIYRRLDMVGTGTGSFQLEGIFNSWTSEISLRAVSAGSGGGTPGGGGGGSRPIPGSDVMNVTGYIGQNTIDASVKFNIQEAVFKGKR